ncbi:uncharacterized protein LOC133899497 [Phragmites australis]|uniref:uncharacterized protein LOC133899497 n=1 Tax=Phragmites australis TaxID=29695 RepID=UPI002D77720E|nr:uncharacterized protein LOC133899497 [Phragmites australis]
MGECVRSEADHQRRKSEMAVLKMSKPSPSSKEGSSDQLRDRPKHSKKSDAFRYISKQKDINQIESGPEDVLQEVIEVGYRRMGNLEQNLGNITATSIKDLTATSATLLHQLRYLWKSPRGAVVRIEALALVAIALSFLLAALGSCRRWSSHWIVQKGVLAANVLSLSLGTYSIGLMQSSSVKSEMYPIWAVSMLTLFGCVNSITPYGLGYSQLWKILYQLCLYCGYVMLISISTISSDVGYIAIGVLSAITFVKGFHRSLALVLPSMQRDMIKMIAEVMSAEVIGYSGRTDDPDQLNGPDLIGYRYVVHWPLDKSKAKFLPTASSPDDVITIDKIMQCNEVRFLSDVCLSLSLSHLLQRRFYRLHWAESKHWVARKFVLEGLLLSRDGNIDYQRAFKVIAVELAFLYDTFFSSNAFLHYYESKGATIWALASIVGIFFVGVVAVIPGTRSTRTPGGTIVVDTTMPDLIITLVILVSLALLQFWHLIRCWSSNWARVAFACDYIKNGKQLSRWMRLRRWILGRIECDSNYLWQNKLGQYSLIESISTRECKLFSALGGCLYQTYFQLLGILGLQYIEQVFREMWGIKTGDAVELSADVKTAIVDFLIRSEGKLHDWPSSLDRDGWSVDYRFLFFPDHVVTILRWHVATCYCELVMHQEGFSIQDEDVEEIAKKNHGVATTLSKYCAYLMVSAPRLLNRKDLGTKSVYEEVLLAARVSLHGVNDKLEAMRRLGQDDESEGAQILRQGVAFGKRLEKMPNRWKVLADFWVGALVYAAPSDNAEEHIECLDKGGEFITHVWALLSHAGILKWKGGSTDYDESPDELGGSADDSESEDELDESADDSESEDELDGSAADDKSSI